MGGEGNDDASPPRKLRRDFPRPGARGPGPGGRACGRGSRARGLGLGTQAPGSGPRAPGPRHRVPGSGPGTWARSLGRLPGPSPKPRPQAQALGPRPLPWSGHRALGQDRTDAIGALTEINESGCNCRQRERSGPRRSPKSLLFPNMPPAPVFFTIPSRISCPYRPQQHGRKGL